MKTEFNKLDLDLYYEKLENGLDVYIVPKNNINNIYVTYTTKYGSADTTFVLDGKKIETEKGIAHFLEHKLFEQKDNKDPFTLFDENGASANAATYINRTSYLFSGPKKFKKNLNILLDFINEPYFTDENVEKEKGIIIQELKMGEDDIKRVGYATSLYNTLIKDPTKYKIIGTEESILKIKKEDLYLCYNTFYQPNNMFLVITGNVKVDNALKIVKDNQAKKQTPKYEFEKVNYNEPDHVYKKKETVKMNVSVPKLYFTYKINIENIDMESRFIYKYLSIYFDSLFGSVSDFQEEIENKNICNDNISLIFTRLKSHMLVTLVGETEKPEKLAQMIQKYIGKIITIDDFNRKKKVILSSAIYMSDNIYYMNNKIVNDIIYNGKVITNMYEENNNLKYYEMLSILDKINFKNYAEVYIKKKEN